MRPTPPRVSQELHQPEAATTLGFFNRHQLPPKLDSSASLISLPFWTYQNEMEICVGHNQPRWLDEGQLKLPEANESREEKKCSQLGNLELGGEAEWGGEREGGDQSVNHTPFTLLLKVATSVNKKPNEWANNGGRRTLSATHQLYRRRRVAFFLRAWTSPFSPRNACAMTPFNTRRVHWRVRRGRTSETNIKNKSAVEALEGVVHLFTNLQTPLKLTSE